MKKEFDYVTMLPLLKVLLTEIIDFSFNKDANTYDLSNGKNVKESIVKNMVKLGYLDVYKEDGIEKYSVSEAGYDYANKHSKTDLNALSERNMEKEDIKKDTQKKNEKHRILLKLSKNTKLSIGMFENKPYLKTGDFLQSPISKEAFFSLKQERLLKKKVGNPFELVLSMKGEQYVVENIITPAKKNKSDINTERLNSLQKRNGIIVLDEKLETEKEKITRLSEELSFEDKFLLQAIMNNVAINVVQKSKSVGLEYEPLKFNETENSKGIVQTVSRSGSLSILGKMNITKFFQKGKDNLNDLENLVKLNRLSIRNFRNLEKEGLITSASEPHRTITVKNYGKDFHYPCFAVSLTDNGLKCGAEIVKIKEKPKSFFDISKIKNLSNNIKYKF